MPHGASALRDADHLRVDSAVLAAQLERDVRSGRTWRKYDAHGQVHRLAWADDDGAHQEFDLNLADGERERNGDRRTDSVNLQGSEYGALGLRSGNDTFDLSSDEIPLCSLAVE